MGLLGWIGEGRGGEGPGGGGGKSVLVRAMSAAKAVSAKVIYGSIAFGIFIFIK